ncbi:hypothetical protein AB1Y20_019069 [Prymnesium parvum]|uniref:Uncharacterized protein n=1 Tax=Prymnesium parvum TaxID=97485 RepID=A0AB34JQC4_PRYPA
MSLPSLQVASSVQTAPTWEAARAALHTRHVNAVVVHHPLLRPSSRSAWGGAARDDVSCAVRWSRVCGLEEGSERKLGLALLPLLRHGAADLAPSLSHELCRLAHTFGLCLADHGLLEEGDETVLRLRCAVQADVRDFGASERLFHRDHLPLRLVSTLHGDGTVVLPDEAVISAQEWRGVCRLHDHDEVVRRAIEEHGHDAAIDHLRCSPYYPLPRKIDPIAAHNFRVRRPKSALFQCRAGDVLLMKGNGWPDASGHVRPGDLFASGIGAVHRAPARPPKDNRVLLVIDRMTDIASDDERSRARRTREAARVVRFD